MSRILSRLFEWIGVERASVSHAERVASTCGGVVAIISIWFVSERVVGAAGAGMLVASMGASTVLLFAVPHGPLSQPWPLVGGHLLSAVVGVSCARLIENDMLAAGCAVGLAVGVMYYLRCIHPPGGATALSAVTGGAAVDALGYQFVLTPVLVNVLVILTVAIAFNAFFPWRRYPLYLYTTMRMKEARVAPAEALTIEHGDFVYALSQIDSFVDVSEDDLLRIYELATQRSRSQRLDSSEIVRGSYYSNGLHTEDWSVRLVADENIDPKRGSDMVIYKVVAGQGRRGSGYVSRDEFARWARERVQHDGKYWQRMK